MLLQVVAVRDLGTPRPKSLLFQDLWWLFEARQWHTERAHRPQPGWATKPNIVSSQQLPPHGLGSHLRSIVAGLWGEQVCSLKWNICWTLCHCRLNSRGSSYWREDSSRWGQESYFGGEDWDKWGNVCLWDYFVQLITFCHHRFWSWFE